MSKKIKTLVLDRDLSSKKPEKYPISKDGSRIVIKDSGKGRYAPLFDNDCIIEVPKRFGPPEKMAIVRNRAKSCVKFRKRPTELANKIQTVENLQEVIDGANADPPSLEAKHLLNEVLAVIEASGDDDYLTPDPEVVDDAASSDMIKNFGRQDQPPTTLMDWATLGLLIFIALKIMGMI